MKYGIPGLMSFLLIIFIASDFFGSRETYLFHNLSDIDRISFSTGYEWTKGPEGDDESSLLNLIGSIKKVEIAHKEFLSHWTYPDPVIIVLFKGSKEIYRLTVYQSIERSIGRQEGLILELDNRLYLMPRVDWNDFTRVSMGHDMKVKRLLPSLDVKDIAFYSIHSLREGTGANEYRYSLERDLEGEWQLSLNGLFPDQEISLNKSEVNLLLLQLDQWKGLAVSSEEEMSGPPRYSMEIRDNLGNSYQWQVGSSFIEGYFLVRSVNDNSSYLLGAEELQRVSPPVNRLFSK